MCAGAGAVAGVGALWEGVGPGIGAGERSRLLGRLIPAVRAAEPSGPPSRSRRQEFNFLADLVEETSPGRSSTNSTQTQQTLCLELISVLRRCFEQQGEVRFVFYRGVVEVAMKNPELIEVKRI